jgi:hypothetical protein
LILFMAMFFCPTAYIDSRGRFVSQSSRWHFYRTYVPMIFAPVREMGPASGTADTVPMAFLEHGGASLFGGFAALALGWGIRRVRWHRRDAAEK